MKKYVLLTSYIIFALNHLYWLGNLWLVSNKYTFSHLQQSAIVYWNRTNIEPVVFLLTLNVEINEIKKLIKGNKASFRLMK